MVATEQYQDTELELVWKSWGQHLVVHGPNKEQLFSSVTGDISSKLSDRQVQWILDIYEKQRKVYVF
jgi:hypothetical protein